MEIWAERVTLEKPNTYVYSAYVTFSDVERVEVVLEYMLEDLRKKGAPAIMPYAELALQLGRNYCKGLKKDYS